MKKPVILILLLSLGIVLASSCKKDDDDGDNNNNNNNTGNTLPDAVLNLEVSGAESHTINFTLPQNVATENSINGAHVSVQQLLTINSSDLPITWLFNIVANAATVHAGTYNINPGMSGFTNSSAGTGYLAVSGTLEITKATLYQGVASVDDWFIDGTFSGTYEDNNTPPNTVTISGSFSGVNIKAQ